MPKIPLTSLSLAPQGQAGVNPPDTGLISDAIGKAIQSAGMDRARGAIAVAQGEMEKGKAYAGIAASIGDVAGAFVALGEREKKLNGIETSIAFDKDLLQFYADQDEFERLNASNPIDKNGNNIFMMNAQKGLSMLQKKYGEKELDQNTAVRIAGQISDASVRVPVAARTSALKTRADNINSEFKVKMDSKDFAGAAALNDQLKTDGLISDSQHAENKSALDVNQKTFTIDQTRKEIDAFLLDRNPKAAEEKLKTLEPFLTPEEFKLEQSTFTNKNARASAINGMADQIVENPMGVRSRVLKELKRREADPNWKSYPGGDDDVKFLDTSDLVKIKGDLNDSISPKAQSEFISAREAIKNYDAGMTGDEFIKQFKTEFPNLMLHDEGRIADLLKAEYADPGNLNAGKIIGYVRDKINKLDFTDKSNGGMSERVLVKDLIESYTDGNIKAELNEQYSDKERLSTNTSAQPIVAQAEKLIDLILETDDILVPGVDEEVPAQPITGGPAAAAFRIPGIPFGIFGFPSFGEVEGGQPTVNRPGKYEEFEIVSADGKTKRKETRFVPDYSETEESKRKLYKLEIANVLKEDFRKKLAAGRYTNPADGSFNREDFLADLNYARADLIKVVTPEGKVIKPGQTTATGQEVPPASPMYTKPEDTSSDVDFPVPPSVKAIQESGADVTVPAPPAADTPVPTPPGAMQTRSVQGVGVAVDGAATNPPVNTPLPGYGTMSPGEASPAPSPEAAAGIAAQVELGRQIAARDAAGATAKSQSNWVPEFEGQQYPGQPNPAAPTATQLYGFQEVRGETKEVAPPVEAAPVAAAPVAAAPVAAAATLPAPQMPIDLPAEAYNITGQTGIPAMQSSIDPELYKEFSAIIGTPEAPGAPGTAAQATKVVEVPEALTKVLTVPPKEQVTFGVIPKTREVIARERGIAVDNDGSNLSTVENPMISLDYNDSDNASANYVLVVIPNYAEAEDHPVHVAANAYVKATKAWLETKKDKDGNPIKVGEAFVKTTKGNKGGKANFIHTEPFFVKDIKTYEAIYENSEEYAAILANTLGTIPGATFIAPHKAKDPGAMPYSGNLPGERDFAIQKILPNLDKIRNGELTINVKGATAQAAAPAAPAARGAVPTTVATGGTIEYLNKVGAATKVNVTPATAPVIEGPVTPLDMPMTVRKGIKNKNTPNEKTVYVAPAKDVYNYALERFKGSPLKGMTVEDGADYGIVKGTPEEWATFVTKLVEKESEFQIDTKGDDGKYIGGSNGLGQLSPKDGSNKLNYTFGKDFTMEELKNPLFNIEATIRVVEALVFADRVIRKDDRGAGRYFPNTLRIHRAKWKEPVKELPEE